VGGNLIDFPGDVSTKGADLVTSKILMNDIISDPKEGTATCIDIKDFYLGNPLPNKEFIRFQRSIIPADTFWQQYKLDELVDEAGNLYADFSQQRHVWPPPSSWQSCQ
jgi:hypothetical protein